MIRRVEDAKVESSCGYWKAAICLRATFDNFDFILIDSLIKIGFGSKKKPTHSKETHNPNNPQKMGLRQDQAFVFDATDSAAPRESWLQWSAQIGSLPVWAAPVRIF